MAKYFQVFFNSILGTAQWVWKLIIFQVPWYQNYFYGLILISLLVWALELSFPWRKDQKAIRKDFWLDGFYMFFNFFIFSIFISGFYSLFEMLANEIGLSIDSFSLFSFGKLPGWAQLLIFFLLSDFVQWFTHVILHRVPAFWRFHQVHHSVQEMGFAAHLRYHWMENLFYKPLKTFVVMIIGGFEPEQAYFIHFFSICVGHLNHANVKITWGPLKYILNNPVMHLWHHSRYLPDGQMPGVNFGISLSLWDYIFGTNYIPEEKGDIELGFDGLEKFPHTFLKQSIYGFRKEKI
jgi:sterol desaturase/sphingolipid hydroxylase (fatty acid hydroxylase superfamily)